MHKLEFLIKESWTIAHQELHGTPEYHQAWQTFINYVHEYRIAHGFCNPSQQNCVLRDCLTRSADTYSQQIKSEIGATIASNAMDEKQGSFIRNKPADTSKLAYLTQKLKGGEHYGTSTKSQDSGNRNERSSKARS
jgi:hypothetical protein